MSQRTVCARTLGIALAAGCTVPEIQAILGHKTPQMAIAYVERANKGKLVDSANRKRELTGPPDAQVGIES